MRLCVTFPCAEQIVTQCINAGCGRSCATQLAYELLHLHMHIWREVPLYSKCWIDVAGTFSQQPWVIFQLVSRFVTYRHFPTNLSLYLYFFHTFSRNVSSWLYCRIAARTASTVSLTLFQICSAVVAPQIYLNILD